MLHEIYLFNPQGPDILQGKPMLGGRVPMLALRMVVPRALCTHLRISCAGVPPLRMRSFAQLQVLAKAPFAKYGSCVIRQGNWLHAWVWDASIEESFAEKHGSSRNFSTVAQSVCSAPTADGVIWHTSPVGLGVEAQLWKNKLLIDSLWFDTRPSIDAWTTLRAQTPELEALGWPSTLSTGESAAMTTTLSHPWGRNLTPRKKNKVSFNFSRLIPAGLAFATALLAGWGASLYTQKTAYEQAISMGMESQQNQLANMEPAQKARQQTQKTLTWVNAAYALAPTPTTSEILTALAEIFTRQGLVVRELDINLPTVQATLVSPGAGSPRLTAVLGALESHPWFYDARFVDVSGGTGFKFTWRVGLATTTPATLGAP